MIASAMAPPELPVLIGALAANAGETNILTSCNERGTLLQNPEA
jgi:hypothetical protein